LTGYYIKTFRLLPNNKNHSNRIEPHNHICMVSTADLSNPSLLHRGDKSFLLRHSWLSWIKIQQTEKHKSLSTAKQTLDITM